MGRAWRAGGAGGPERHSHAVHDEAQEHEHVVALVVLHVAYEALAQLAQVAGSREAPLVHEGAPGPDGRAAPLQPLTADAGRDQFRQQGPGGRGQVSSGPGWSLDPRARWGLQGAAPGVLGGKGPRILDPRARGG